MPEENKVKDAADAVKGIVEAVPVYQDVVQPAAKEIGAALQTVAKTVHIALAPVSGLVWGYEKIRDFVSVRVAEKLKNVPMENIRIPNPSVAGPALEALRYSGHEESLREMYANLLATSLDCTTAHSAHPSFVEIVKNLSPDEAKVIRLFVAEESFPLIDVLLEAKDKSYHIKYMNFSDLGERAGCQHPDLTPNYLDNLCRLGLSDIPTDRQLTGANIYEPLEEDKRLNS